MAVSQEASGAACGSVIAPLRESLIVKTLIRWRRSELAQTPLEHTGRNWRIKREREAAICLVSKEDDQLRAANSTVFADAIAGRFAPVPRPASHKKNSYKVSALFRL
jgi:hypothetical protein